MPCLKAKKIREQEEYIIKNRKIIDPFAGISNPLDIIKTFHKPRLNGPLIQYQPYNKLISQQYRELDNDQIYQLIEYCIMLYKENESDQAKRVTSCLITFIDADITSFLNHMILREDYHPAFLFKGANLGTKKFLLEKYLQNNDAESDLFKVIIWVYEKDHNLDVSIRKLYHDVLSEYVAQAFIVKQSLQVSREKAFKKTTLGHINICASGESWPICNNVPLTPVIQLVISDLPYIPPALEGIKYITIFIHPDDPASLLEREDALIIRTYATEEIKVAEYPHLIENTSSPNLIEFEVINDYPSDYQYPSPLDFLTYYSPENNIIYKKDFYNWDNDFTNLLGDRNDQVNMVKILGYPEWIQWPEMPEDCLFVMQIKCYGLWNYGETSTLYIFRDKVSKEFGGFIQMA
jgi:hypothetical protein